MVARSPEGLILEILDVFPPVYGPTGGGTGSVAGFNPPSPPSATYRYPSGPNLRPRGLLRPGTLFQLGATNEADETVRAGGDFGRR
jgi:hypothetical protein